MRKFLAILLLLFSSNSFAYETALVLSGGGARSIASVGVIEVLQEQGIKPDIIIGTSGGSLVGALYADNPDIEALKKIVNKITKDDLINTSWFRGFLSLFGFDTVMVNSSKGEEYLSKHIKSKEFHELKIPFVAVVTSLETGEPVGIMDGNIAHAVKASCAVPGFFKPVEIDGKLYVDGGATSPTSVDIAKKLGAKRIIAVDTILPEKRPDPTNSWKVLYKAYTFQFSRLNDFIIKDADIIIKPDIKDVRLFDYHRSEELIELGRNAAKASLKLN